MDSHGEMGLPAASAASTRLSLVNGDATTVEILAVHRLDGVSHGLLVAEGHESEAPGPPGLAIVDDLRFKDLAVGGEGVLQRLAVGGPGEPADKAPELNFR